MRMCVAGCVGVAVLLSALPAAAGPNVAGSAAGGPRAPSAAPSPAQDTPISDETRRRVIDGLLRALQDENEAVRARALEALAGMRDERAIPGLLQALSDAREGIRASALEALAQFSTPEAIGGLMIGLKDASPAVRALAARHVSRLIGARPLQNDPQDVEILTGLLLLQDAEPDVRAEAVAGLSRLRRPEAVPSLLPMLQDVDTQVRVETAVALGLLADPRAIDALTAALTDAEPAVREEAARALGLIARGQPRGVPPAAAVEETAPAAAAPAPAADAASEATAPVTAEEAAPSASGGGTLPSNEEGGGGPSVVVPVPPRPPVPSDPPPSPPVPSPASRPTGEAAAPPAFDGPPAPVPPAVVNRDAEGRTTIRATRLDAPLRIDGVLDENIYRTVEPVSGLIQIEPRPGEQERQKTEFWISFDDEHIYYSVRAWESEPSEIIATEMRRDNNTIFSGNDMIAVMFDTFYDRRNGFAFNVNTLGGFQDGQITNNRQFSADFNPVWEVQTGRFDGGWTQEAAIPFKSLRYRPGRAQVWGFNLMRSRPASNEIAFLMRMPPGRSRAGMTQISLGATIVGLEAPPPSRNFEVKPYVTSSMTSNMTAEPRISNDPDADAGLDVRYALTEGLLLNATYNTDFAQVEADEQQINLTRFSLFFPEKREFFLENQGTFSFGGVRAGRGRGRGGVPTLFYSRRIGLDAGQLVPIDAGGRVTGRIGRYEIGLINMQTGDEPVSGARRTNFSVVRVKRDVLRNSAIGVLATNRSERQAGPGTNQAYGVDGVFSFGANLIINTYWARTRTDGLHGDDTSYRAQLDYPADRWGVQLDHFAVGDNFNPEMGFVRRDDMVRHWAQFRFSPRPRADRPITRTIRRFSYTGSIEYIENGDGRLESREGSAAFSIDFQNSDSFTATYTESFEFLPAPFRIARGVVLPVGVYDFNTYTIGYSMGSQRSRAVNVSFGHGTFYNGHRTTFSLNRGRFQFANQFFLEPSYSMNRITLVQGDFTTHLGGSRITYTVTPRMFTSALVQYSSSSKSVSTNARLRWEYSPGSELFVVYNEQRDTLTRGPRGLPELTNRALIIKVNRLFRF